MPNTLSEGRDSGWRDGPRNRLSCSNAVARKRKALEINAPVLPPAEPPQRQVPPEEAPQNMPVQEVPSEEVPTEEGRRSGLDRRLIALSASQ